MEHLTPEGYRIDGRRKDEPRSIIAKLGGVEAADGSASLSMGNTRVIAYVYGPIHNKTRGGNQDGATVTCEYSTATFSTLDRKSRSKGDRKSNERSHWLQKTFEAAIMRHLYPRSQIDIYVEVLQADGGEVSAAINAISLALVDAGIPMGEFVTATTVGMIRGNVLVDLNNAEENAGGVTLLCALFNRSKKVSMLELDSKLQVAAFNQLFEAAEEACGSIAQTLRATMIENAETLISHLSAQ